MALCGESSSFSIPFSFMCTRYAGPAANAQRYRYLLPIIHYASHQLQSLYLLSKQGRRELWGVMESEDGLRRFHSLEQIQVQPENGLVKTISLRYMVICTERSNLVSSCTNGQPPCCANVQICIISPLLHESRSFIPIYHVLS